MRIVGKIIVLIIGLLSGVSAQTNIPIGTWRNHFSFNNVIKVVDGGNRFFAAASNGIFIYDKEDNSITTISTLEGLQEENISTIAFNTVNDQLLIGYNSGNLDIIQGSEIFNIDLITTSQIIGSKRINDILISGQTAFLITDFGVLNFDLSQRLVNETYRELSSDFGNLEVFGGALYRDSLFIATEEGVLSANITGSVNLLNPNNWFRFGLIDGIPTDEFEIITSTSQGVMVGSELNGLFFYQDQWSSLNQFVDQEMISLSSLNDQFLIVAEDTLYHGNSSFEFEKITDQLITNPNDAVFDQDQNIWTADRVNGLVTNFQGGFQAITPSGPFGNKIFRLRFLDGALFGLPGGFDQNINPLNCDLGYYTFRNGFWENFNTFSQENVFPDFKDITGVINLSGNDRMLFSSAGNGLLDIDNEGNFTIINDTTVGSPLQNNGTESEIIIPSIIQAQEGVWVLNYRATRPLHLLQPDGVWNSFSLPSIFVLDMIDMGENLWILPNPETVGGIIIFEKATGNTRFLTNSLGNGGLAGNEVRALAIDLEGLVWAGTNDGVSVFTNPLNVLNGEVNAIEPIFNNRLLLRGEEITVIEVDGGNQKWIGTRNGVWLFDDQADTQIFNFNTSNSPLPSNNVIDININPLSGEVFFATDAGMVSFRGEATTGGESHSNVKIFPNPVTRDFVGQVGISGLVNDATIKITDVSGKLVAESIANGGTATWNVQGFNGDRAKSGVYLVFSSSEDGEETFVGKIAVVE